MNYMVDPKGHERKRKAKGGLANGILLGSATVLAATTIGASSVSADSLVDTPVSTEPGTELVASAVSDAPAELTDIAVAEPVVEQEVAVEAPVSEVVPSVTTEVATVLEDVPADAEIITNPEDGYSEKVAGNTVTVTSDELADAVSDAKAEGVTVNQEAKVVSVGTASSEEEAKALGREIADKQADDAAKIREAQQELAQAKAEADKKVGQVGYPATVGFQSLELNSEPNASYSTSIEKDGTHDYGSDFYNLSPGEQLVVTYTGIENSSYDGSKISKIVFTYTGKGDGVQIMPEEDPTVTLNMNGLKGRTSSGESRVGFKAEFFDVNEQPITFTESAPAYVSLTSLNRNSPYSGEGRGESIELTASNTEFVPIVGSTIAQDGAAIYSSIIDNSNKAYGAKYDSSKNGVIVEDPNDYWDTLNGPLRYYGAGLLKVTSGTAIEFDIFNEWKNSVAGNDGLYYFGFNTKVATPGILTKPNVSYTLYSYDTVGSVVLDNLIQGTDTKLTETVIVKPAGTETGTDYTTSHQPTITTTDGRTFTYVSSSSNTTGKVVLGETKVVNYYVENKRGDVTVEYKDEAGNTLIPKVTDTPTTEVGKDYDTTDQRKSTITINGDTYELIKTEGKETGKVVEGNTNIVYIYQTVKGDVLVKYQDTNGNTLKDDVVDTPSTSVGKSYDTKDNKPSTITLTDGSTYRIVEAQTKGAETGKVVKGTTVITYVYEPVLGNVTVEFKDDKGNTLKPKEVDTPETNVGKDYNTVDHRTSTIVTPDGKTYDHVKTDGKESGKVVEGNTNVIYIYQEAKGLVVVRYQDTLGNTIKDQVTDTPETSTGVAYDTTDNKPQIITTDSGASYRINTGYTKGAETGKVVRGETVITYVYEQILGDVLVKYQDRKGGEVIPDVVDTPETSTGVSYDTTDNKPQIIERADGSTFRLVPTLTKGQEKGKVVEGTTTIIYIYDEIKGDVVVDYQNKANGETISPRVTDTPTTSTGTNYDTTDNKPVTIVTPDGRTFRIDPNVTKGLEVGKVIEGRTTVTYLYDELKGNVIVHYQNEEGKTIRKDVYDLKDSSTNRDYDTTDNKPVTIVTDEGRTYDIVLDKTKGNETGKTVVGDTHVTYTYKEIFGDVVVHYEDEGGKVIYPDAFDTKKSSTGKAYDTTDLKHAAIFHDGSVYNIIVTKTKGVEKGLVARGTTHVTYVYKVEEPVSKKVVNNEAGRNIEGKTMLPGDLLVNRILIDNDQNKGLVGLTEADKEVGLFIVENYPEKFTEPVLEAVRIVYAGTDKVADIKTTTVLYNSITEAPQAIQEQLKAQGYELKEGDKFSLTTSLDNKAYTENFALKGIQLELVFPTRVLKAAEASEFENVALVGDFNGVAITNVAINRVPKIDPKKDVFTTLADGMKNENSIDGKTAKLGDVVTFKFQGSFIPGDRGTELTSYGHNDTLSKLLRYDGNFKYFSDIEVALTNGTTLKAGEEITRYATQVIEHNEDGTTTVKFRLTDEFLKLLGDKPAFQFSKYVQATVIAEGLIENTQDEIINETVYTSNKVTVDVVPEPTPVPTPTPTPVPSPAPVPVASVPTTPAQPTLPETGEADSAMAALGLVTLAALGLTYTRKRN